MPNRQQEDRPLVSIITPSWEGLQFTKQMMESVEENTDWPFELIIVDNGSTDGVEDFVLNANFKMAGQFIRNETNMGFAKANNQGATIAKGEYLCLLNNDVIATKGWLTAMMRVFEEEKGCGAVGARLIHPGNGTIQHAGVIEMDSGMPDHVYFNMPMDYKLAMERKEYFAVTGACMLISRELYIKLGGLDEAYVNGWEDMDLCQKIRKAGYKIFYEPNAMLYHYESRTSTRYLNENANFSLYMGRWVLNKNSIVGDNLIK